MTLIQKFKLRIFGIKPKNKKQITPSGIYQTTVSKDFLISFPVWDADKFNNIQII